MTDRLTEIAELIHTQDDDLIPKAWGSELIAIARSERQAGFEEAREAALTNRPSLH